MLEHGACDAGSCLHAISVSLGDTHIQLRDSGSSLLGCAHPQSSSAPPCRSSPSQTPVPGAVLVDGQDVGLPWSGPKGLSVSRASSTFLLLRWPGAQVLWGVSDPAAYVTLDPRHARQVCCGAGEWLDQATVGPDVTVPCPLLWPRCRVCAAPSPGTSRMTS